ncbi:unnamed protein product [Cuscuta campestris]|uniref:Uncharacterized protein n=1 Tax=Cuscuta campestris TaxID=132261 RepID=A0A484KNI2_9ASTE|nr:unnamed protein product [Cuscuta campestris]
MGTQTSEGLHLYPAIHRYARLKHSNPERNSTAQAISSCCLVDRCRGKFYAIGLLYPSLILIIFRCPVEYQRVDIKTWSLFFGTTTTMEDAPKEKPTTAEHTPKEKASPLDRTSPGTKWHMHKTEANNP